MFPWGTVFLLFAATSTIAAMDAENSNEYYEHLEESEPYNYHRRNGSSARSYQHMIEIETKFFLYWNDPDIEEFSLDLQVVYYGTGWVALGFPPESVVNSAETLLMVGSDAVIGLPSENKVQYYELKSKDLKGVQLDQSETEKSLSRKSISQSSTKTVMSFTMAFSSDKGVLIRRTGINTFLYAYGSSNTLGYHTGRGIFQIDFSDYSTPASNVTETIEFATNTSNLTSAVVSSSEANRSRSTKLIIAHGVLATVAFLVVTPIAISTAILRDIVYLRKRWYYLHSGLNVFAWCLSIAAVACAITAVTRSGSGHFTNRHEILGIIITVSLTFQIVGALYRPSEDAQGVHLSCSKRRVWKKLHQCVGVLILIFGLAQVYDGMLMLQQSYGVNASLTSFFWASFVPWLVLTALLWTIAKAKPYEVCGNDAQNKPPLNASTHTYKTQLSLGLTELELHELPESDQKLYGSRISDDDSSTENGIMTFNGRIV